MSSRDSWVPLAAGVVLGAGLLVALYLLTNREPNAEELERQERAKADELNNAMAALRAQSAQPSIFKRWFGFLAGSGDGGGTKFVGAAALLLGLLGFLYKNYGDRFNLRALFGRFNMKAPFGGKKKDPCEGTSAAVKKPAPPEKPIVPCDCTR